MARVAHVRHLDDLDGSEASETVIFSLGRRSYEIDLSQENAAKFRSALAPFVAAARSSGDARRPHRTRAGDSPPPPGTIRPKAKEIRQWARRHGHKVADRGQIPSSVLQAYRDEVG
jgi:hypothetical protein